MKFTNRERRPTIHRCVGCLCVAITAFETSRRADVVRPPCAARCVCLQESRDFPFGKVGAFHVRIGFQNTPIISKRHEVEISILLVNDSYRSVIPQTSLHNCAVRVFNLIAAVAQASPARVRGCEDTEDQDKFYLHPFQSATLQQSANRTVVSASQFSELPFFAKPSQASIVAA